MYGKSLSARPLGLRSGIWPSNKGFDSTACTLHTTYTNGNNPGTIEGMANLSPPDLVRFRA